ncbi:glycosyltransferase family 61 protein [Neobacillus drentensis]|uniref:glycosyltransferase family 61 protein n=1 Tax=Neobacillus drentensis TaxID=220684 RepID=UPI000825C3B9|nr:glycosyltransferase family 61 protein [Neobacillus drentensis]
MNNFPPPIGFFHSIKEWEAAQGRTSSNIKEIYPETPVSYGLTRRPPCPPSWYPSEFAGGYFAVIPNGRICGANGAIITPDNQLLWDVSFEGVHIAPETHSIFQEKTLPEVTHIKDAVDLTHVYSRNYYHWMYEVIPRTDLLAQCGPPVELYIVNTEQEKPYQNETLHQLGISDDRLLKTHSGFHVQAEKLLLPAQPSFPTKWGYDYLRKVFISNHTQNLSSDKKRIFISRRWSRKITNEEQVMKVLTKYGFVKVDLESLSVAEQVQLFSGAEVVIAAHGAALTNLTFCRPGTKVLEIFTPTYIIPHYWAISTLGHLDYDYFIGQSGKYVIRNGNRWTGDDDITINLSKFKASLKKMRL